MRDTPFQTRVRSQLDEIVAQGLGKTERIIVTPQGAKVGVRKPDGAVVEALNLCGNNYLGLAADPRGCEAAARAARDSGAGMASVRFICGTQQIHKVLEAEIAAYLGYEDAILFGSAFDANTGVFEALLSDRDAIVSDTLNHASIIDGVRLCKASRYRFAGASVEDLETQLEAARAAGAQTIVIATDGVFSMDGYIADLPAITRLADQYDALVMVDDCHATGLLGPGGRGTAAFHGLEGRVDVLTGTLGKALGGAMGGYVAASRDVIALLRERARPYLFSNALPPAVCAAALEAISIARSAEGDSLRAQLFANAEHFRRGMDEAGFQLLPGQHPIIPVMLGDAGQAQAMAAALLDHGVLVSAFAFPVVPRDKARIRTQVSAAHTPAQVDAAIEAFRQVRDLQEAA